MPALFNILLVAITGSKIFLVFLKICSTFLSHLFVVVCNIGVNQSVCLSIIYWFADSCECQTLHSNCTRHTFQACIMTQCSWPRFHTQVTLSWFYVESSIIHVESSIKVCFCEVVTAMSVKPCIVFWAYLHWTLSLTTVICSHRHSRQVWAVMLKEKLKSW